MLPTNKYNETQAGCTPVSSNCVIWNGPDIPCIQLCTGDSISDVTAKLAQQLCDLLDQVKLSNFSTELLCFDPICPPLQNLEDLIKFILNKLCELQSCCATHSTPQPGCPDCLVTVAPCFYTTTPAGDTVTQMQLVDYARAIGVKVCDILTQLTAINTTLTDYGARITNLENQPQQAPTAPVLVPATCLNNASSTVVDAIILTTQTLCNLQSATGDPDALLNAIGIACANLSQQPSMAVPGSTMGSIPGWIPTVTNLADSVNNLWLTICDLRAGVANLANCCNKGCDQIIVNMIATLHSGVITLNFTGTMPDGFLDCSTTGNTLVITDMYGNNQTVQVNVADPLRNNTAQTITLNAYMNPASNYDMVLYGCWNNPSTNVTCERQVFYTLVNSIVCPAVVYTPTSTAISYVFVAPATIAAGGSIQVQLFAIGGVSPLAVNTSAGPISAGAPISGTFSALTSGTNYNVRVLIKANVDSTVIACPFTQVVTIGAPSAFWLQSGADNGVPTPAVFFLQADGSKWLL